MQPRSQNDFFLGYDGEAIRPTFEMQITTKQQAYRTAAWLKVMSGALPDEPGQDGITFEQVEETVKNNA